MHKAVESRSETELSSLSANGKLLKFIYFWIHTPKIERRVDHSCFSQWYPSPFTADGINYATAEHYMMAAKARLFDDGLP